MVSGHGMRGGFRIAGIRRDNPRLERRARTLSDLRVVEVAELDLAFEPWRWPFAEIHAARIAAHWAQLRKEKREIYNGRVLLMRRPTLARREDGELRLEGAYFETDYADLVAWRAFGSSDEPVVNCFSMAALRGADGVFLLGEMAPHTLNGGQIYFPAGTPDSSDVFDSKVDLDASARRELLEETGVSAEGAVVGPAWTVVFAGWRIACMKPMTLPLSAADAKARIEAFLARDPLAELSCIHVVRRVAGH
jgi:8-oxo-dGTP pyrophosphatase MutT (NUDIX family)